ncbi:MAG: lamin tail domain-containing protein [Chitinophagales bacterium]
MIAICLFFIGICKKSPAQNANPYDVLIDEIFCDPSPPVGLPNAEFLELRNVSAFPIDLKNWQIKDPGHNLLIKSSFILQPDSFLIICSASASDYYEKFGTVLGLAGFPALNNDGQTLFLVSPEGRIIHALNYDKTWYQNDLKKEGGWSLEMIDTKNPCSGKTNWKASIDPLGGSPGKINSMDGVNPDISGPWLIRTVTEDDQHIILLFNETLDSATAAQPGHYLVEPMGRPMESFPLAPMNNGVRLKLPIRMDTGIIYQVSVEGLVDCAGNPSLPGKTSPAGMPMASGSSDLIINEVLYNPPSNGYDYVEIYNRSKKIIDLNKWAFANRDAGGNLMNIARISIEPRLIFPGDYLVFSENSDWVEQHYQVKYPEHLLELTSMPSLPDDKGNLVLLNEQGAPIDELSYHHQWQFALLADEAGVALERVDFDQPTQNPDNWTSAASTAGFGTPGYQNSTFHLASLDPPGISVNPKLFSPDNDGIDDFCFIQLNMPGPGFACNLTVFDASGRPVRYLLRNAILSAENSLRWDGMDENHRPLPMGIYIVFAELFNLKGEIQKSKHAVALARRN